jgi:hypothetical protein
MSRVLAGSRVAIAAVVAAALLVIGGGAYAAASSGGAITACVHKKGGALYEAKKCAKHDKKLTWNATGLQGSQGTAGAQGMQGIQGIQGIQGVQGPSASPIDYASTSGAEGSTAHTIATFGPITLSEECNTLVNGEQFFASASSGTWSYVGTLFDDNSSGNVHEIGPNTTASTTTTLSSGVDFGTNGITVGDVELYFSSGATVYHVSLNATTNAFLCDDVGSVVTAT